MIASIESVLMRRNYKYLTKQNITYHLVTYLSGQHTSDRHHRGRARGQSGLQFSVRVLVGEGGEEEVEMSSEVQPSRPPSPRAKGRQQAHVAQGQQVGSHVIPVSHFMSMILIFQLEFSA